MDLIRTAVHDSSVPLDEPFVWIVLVSMAAVTGSVLALLGAFGLVISGRAE